MTVLLALYSGPLQLPLQLPLQWPLNSGPLSQHGLSAEGQSSVYKREIKLVQVLL